MVESYYIAYHGPEMYLFKRYVMTTRATCGKYIVVFDGYTDGPTVKDMTHQRRGQTNYVDVHCEKLTVKKGIFLSNKKNKQRFIDKGSVKS